MSSTQSIPGIYYGAILVAHSTSSLANHIGIVVRRRPEALFLNPRRAATRDATDTTSSSWTAPSSEASGALQLSLLVSLPFVLKMHSIELHEY